MVEHSLLSGKGRTIQTGSSILHACLSSESVQKRLHKSLANKAPRTVLVLPCWLFQSNLRQGLVPHYKTLHLVSCRRFELHPKMRQRQRILNTMGNVFNDIFRHILSSFEMFFFKKVIKLLASKQE